MRWETKKNPRFVYGRQFAYLPVKIGTIWVWWEYVYVVYDREWHGAMCSYYFTEEEAQNHIENLIEAWKPPDSFLSGNRGPIRGGGSNGPPPDDRMPLPTPAPPKSRS